MVSAIAKWGTMTGIWKTVPNSTADVSLIAVTDLNPAGENGIDRVEFSRVVNGGAPTVITVSSPSIRTPDYSDASSPVSEFIDNVADGRMTSFYGYGITIDCATVGFGTIEVTAVVYSNAGTATAVSGTITIYNDTDGTDRRPSPKTIFCAANGSDTGDGSIGNPASLRRAVNLCAATPGGSTSAQRDAGGAIVYMLDGDYEIWGPDTVTADQVHTSGHWWITFIAGPAVTITRGPTLTSDDFLVATGNGAGTHFRLRFLTSAQWYADASCLSKTTGVDMHQWIDGGYSGHPSYDPAVPWSVNYADGTTLTLGFNNGTSVDRLYVSCHTRVGCTAGFHDWGWQQDVLFTDMTGVIMQHNNSQPGEQVINCICQRHRYGQNDVAGYVDSILQGNVTVVGSGNGTMVIIATGTTKQTLFSAGDGETFSLETQCAALVGNTSWQLRCGGFGAGNNGDFNVTAVGNYFGQPLVVLANPSAVSETPASTARITTVRTSDGATYRDAIHTDILQMLVGGTDRLYYGVACRDLQYLRGYADSTGTSTRMAFVNCTDGGADINNDLSRPMVDCLFIHCNFARVFWTTSMSGVNVVDCVFLAQAYFPASGFYATNNHFALGGSTFGSNVTTGAWYDGDTTADPWSFQPAVANLDTGSGLYPAPASWRWPGSSGDSRGAWANYGNLDTVDDVITTISSLPDIPIGVPAATATTTVVTTVFGATDIPIGVPAATVDAGTPPVVEPETPTSNRLAGGGSSRGGPPDTNLKKGNPLKDLPLPRGTGFQPLPKFWRHLP